MDVLGYEKHSDGVGETVGVCAECVYQCFDEFVVEDKIQGADGQDYESRAFTVDIEARATNRGIEAFKVALRELGIKFDVTVTIHDEEV